MAIAVAASANLPALLYTMYWRKATAKGVAWGMVAGLVTAVIILLTPTFRAGNAILPISSPGLISIPIGCLVMFLVSLATQPKGVAAITEADQLFDRIRVQAVTGIGSGRSRPHPSKSTGRAH